jgi:hypothetical protein
MLMNQKGRDIEHMKFNLLKNAERLSAAGEKIARLGKAVAWRHRQQGRLLENKPEYLIILAVVAITAF